MLLAVAVVSLLLAAALLVSEPAPYVVTAIDYHFHDAHPTFPIEMDAIWSSRTRVATCTT